jgi:hypothetical protein
MALAGEGAICIWNDITDEGRDAFYAWHLAEHMPERVGIPGFVRGRRYIATDAATAPEFFTLYEVATPEVLLGQDYANRLNAPTGWTRRATQAFRHTARALARVKASFGQGPGGILLSLRFAVAEGEEETVAAQLSSEVLPKLAVLPQVTGAHLCLTNEAASSVKTAESRDRADIEAAPAWVVLVEGCNQAPLEQALAVLLASPAGDGLLGTKPGYYRLEHTRLKTAWAAG